MPIVNKSNYVECKSCKRWMHAPLEVRKEQKSPDGELFGNRALICQECYERADQRPAQEAANGPSLAPDEKDQRARRWKIWDGDELEKRIETSVDESMAHSRPPARATIEDVTNDEAYAACDRFWRFSRDDSGGVEAMKSVINGFLRYRGLL